LPGNTGLNSKFWVVAALIDPNDDSRVGVGKI
jgi:hypothetical protein